ncbi:MAG TPA: STAS domain-containing protein [Methylococcus sp.]|nr:STAS domain-containing protein [Methylococcus sp.]
MNRHDPNRGKELRVELEGRLDAAWSGSLGKSLLEVQRSGRECVALDFSRVDFLSSAGIRVLLMLGKGLHQSGGRLRILDPIPPVREILEWVGLGTLIDDTGDSPRPVAGRAEVAGACFGAVRSLGGSECEVYELDRSALLEGTLVGTGDPFPRPDSARREPVSLRCTRDSLGLGLGAFGTGVDCWRRAGELLAAGGLAVVLPGDDPWHADWMMQTGGFVPEAALLHGICARGGFRHLLRFGCAADTPVLRVSELVPAILEICRAETVAFAAVAEIDVLVGAALQVPPALLPADPFAYPDIQGHLSFTAEPAYADETALIVGFAARRADPLRLRWLRPLTAETGVQGHLHAAVFPYRPMRKGRIDLSETLEGLLDMQTVRGVLHLVNDDREGVGAGESRLRRGAVWCAPLRFREGAVA